MKIKLLIVFLTVFAFKIEPSKNAFEKAFENGDLDHVISLTLPISLPLIGGYYVCKYTQIGIKKGIKHCKASSERNQERYSGDKGFRRTCAGIYRP